MKMNFLMHLNDPAYLWLALSVCAACVVWRSKMLRGLIQDLISISVNVSYDFKLYEMMNISVF